MHKVSNNVAPLILNDMFKKLHWNIPQISHTTTSVERNALWTVPVTLFLSEDLNYEMNF